MWCGKMKGKKEKFLDRIDLSKKYPDYVDKKIIRIGFIFVLIIQMIALTMTGFNLNPAWAECKDTTNYIDLVRENGCDNPFYQATGKVCDRNPKLCTTETIARGEILGSKPPLFAMMANSLSWICLIIAGIVNYTVCRKRRSKKAAFLKLVSEGGAKRW